jgi:hypothetical protein
MYRATTPHVRLKDSQQPGELFEGTDRTGGRPCFVLQIAEPSSIPASDSSGRESERAVASIEKSDPRNGLLKCEEIALRRGFDHGLARTEAMSQ